MCENKSETGYSMVWRVSLRYLLLLAKKAEKMWNVKNSYAAYVYVCVYTESRTTIDRQTRVMEVNGRYGAEFQIRE